MSGIGDVEALEGISDGMKCGSVEVEKEYQIPINLSPIENTKTLHQNITSITSESQGKKPRLDDKQPH
jgi:hypothetical protein